jgi:hypothetical protein
MVIKMCYTGKGPPDLPDAYRGMTTEYNAFKVLTNIIYNRIFDKIGVFVAIPDEQYGFVPGCSTAKML